LKYMPREKYYVRIVPSGGLTINKHRAFSCTCG
jgi:hypothetical protein